MPVSTACPDAPTLQRFALGQMPPEEVESLAEHLMHCAGCVEALHKLEADDALVEVVAAQATADRPRSQAVARLLGRLMVLGPPAADAAAILPTIPDASPHADTPPAAGALPATEATGEVYALLDPPRQPDEIGWLGGYRVRGVLGTGGMGVVFLAEDLQLQRPVALKVLRPPLAANLANRQRFLREARTTAALEHDHIVAIHQVGEDRGVPFLAMQMLHGETLEARLRREGKLPVAEVLRIGRETALGLAAAHARGLIHRDIKPGNVFLEGDKGRVKILDFGLARAVAGDLHLTQLGVIVGTANYMAPEQALGKAVGPGCDLFSLGCVLYRLCTGDVPFHGSDTLSTIAALALEAPRPVGQLNPEVPGPLADLVMQLLAKNHAGRPASAQAVVEALAAIERGPTAGQPGAAAAPAGDSRRDVPPAGRRRRRVALAAAVLLAGAVLAGTLFTLRTRNGTLVVNVMEPDVQVVVDEDQRVTIDSAKVGKVELTPGEHQLTVKRGQEELLTTSFTLRSGGETILVARWEARQAKPQQPATGPRPPEARAGPPSPDDAWVRVIGSLRPDLQAEAVKDELKKRNPGFDGQGWQIATRDRVLTDLYFSTDEVADLTPIRALRGLTRLTCQGQKKGKLTDLSPLKGMSVQDLLCGNNQIKDLTPLKGSPALRVLHLNSNPITDLSPLAGLSLRELLIEDTLVGDLSPLKGMPLKLLLIDGTPVRDLSPLKGMPLERLGCFRSGTRDAAYPIDLTPLKDLPLKHLDCDFIPERDADLLRSIKTMEHINDENVPAAEFWKKVDAQRAAFVGWSGGVRMMPPDRQVEAVTARLRECNPGFDGQVTPTIRDGIVTGLDLASDLVKDLSPVRALEGLRALRCAGSDQGKGVLANLWPLQGLALTRLDVSNNPAILDFRPVAGMKLTAVDFRGTQVDDLSSLKGQPLKEMAGPVEVGRDAAILKAVPTLERINGKSSAEFWKGGDF